MSGQTVVWWHNHSSSREKGSRNWRPNTMPPILRRNRGCPESGQLCMTSATSLNASIAAGEQPASLLVGYQNDQAFYQINDILVDSEPADE